MAGGFGKNSRAGGKRGSSSSSYVSTTTMILIVGFCLYGVYMLTSSSSSSTSTRHESTIKPHKRTAIPSSYSSLPRTVLRYPPPIAAAAGGGGGRSEDIIIKNNNNNDNEDEQQNEEDQEEDKKVVIATTSAGTEEDNLQPEHHQEEEEEERRQQDEEVETRRSDEEFQQQDPDQQQQNEDNATIQSEDQQQNDSINSGQEEPGQNSNDQQQQPQQDEATEEKNDDQPQQKQQQEETTEEKNDDEQQQEKATEQNNDEEQQEMTEQNNDEEQQQQQQSETTTEQNNDEEQQRTMEQNNDEQTQSGTNGEEGNQDETNNNNESQQQSQTDIEDIQPDQNQQQHIQQVTDGTRSQSEEEGGGITSQSQIEHDTDGTTETHEQEQQQQRRQQQQQQQKQQQMEQENAAIGGSKEDNQPSEDNPNASFTDGTELSVPNSDQKTWATQADQSSNEKERRKGDESSQSEGGEGEGNNSGGIDDGGKSSWREWVLCNVTAGSDYIPCLDNEKAIKQLHSFRHFEHRERHCPEESPTCLVPLPKGYKRSIEWPQSRDRIWYNNVPRTKLAEVKGHQNWVKVTGEYLTFPGGGTQFIHGALHYIDFIQKSVPEIAWGKHTRVILDVGCGVASFGGHLFERDVLAMSFAPKDEHEAQVQFALERGIPAISAVMGSQRLPFPSRVFDIVHCARCRVPWHANDGALLLELNRVLRPGGFFVWSATPVYQKLKEDVEIWQAMTTLTKSMCWGLHTIKRDKLNSVGAAMYRKPVSNDCYDKRKDHKPPMCNEDDDPNAAWYVPLQSCMHRVPVDPSVRGSQWPQEWPRRVQVPPYWLNNSQTGVYGRPAPDDFTKDYEHWKRVVNKSYLAGFGIDWSRVRNVMDMRAVYGGFAAALKDMKVWVMNLVNIDSPDTLPIIYERGLFGMYHDWCESFSTYPRTYDLLHADRLFSQVKKRCEILPVIAEVDRIVRPGGKLIVRDESEVVSEVEYLLKSLHWEIRLTYSKNQEGILCAEKSEWRPEKFSASA